MDEIPPFESILRVYVLDMNLSEKFCSLVYSVVSQIRSDFTWEKTRV